MDGLQQAFKDGLQKPATAGIWPVFGHLQLETATYICLMGVTCQPTKQQCVSLAGDWLHESASGKSDLIKFWFTDSSAVNFLLSLKAEADSRKILLPFCKSLNIQNYTHQL